MTTVTPPHWGERSFLYDKSLDYVFSLDIVYHLLAPPRPNRNPLNAIAPEPDAQSTYRVLPAEQFDSPENIKRDIPNARLATGRDYLIVGQDRTVPLDGRLLLETETPGPIALSYTGVLTLDGGTAQLVSSPPAHPISGTAFISSRQEVSVPKYRWLVYNQLIGIGRVLALPPDSAAKRDVWRLELSFDLYLGT